jgi:hypothetical protein
VHISYRERERERAEDMKGSRAYCNGFVRVGPAVPNEYLNETRGAKIINRIWKEQQD